MRAFAHTLQAVCVPQSTRSASTRAQRASGLPSMNGSLNLGVRLGSARCKNICVDDVGAHVPPVLPCALLPDPHVPQVEVFGGALSGRQGCTCEEVELRHVGLHAVHRRARDAEIFGDRPEL